MTPRRMPGSSESRALRAQGRLSVLVALSAVLGFSCACCKDEPATVESILTFLPEHFYWEPKICDVCSAIRNEVFRSDVIIEDLSAFSFVACLRPNPVDRKREPCRGWLEREMSKIPWAVLRGVYSDLNLSDLAQWRVAMFAAPSEEYRRRNPSPSHIRQWEKDLEAFKRLGLGYHWMSEKLATFHEDWREDQTWLKVNPAEYGKKGRTIATLQQRIIAMENGLCPYCCVQFAVSFPERFEIKRLIIALRKDLRVWFVGLGGSRERQLQHWIAKPRRHEPRDTRCSWR